MSSQHDVECQQWSMNCTMSALVRDATSQAIQTQIQAMTAGKLESRGALKKVQAWPAHPSLQSCLC